MSPSQQGCGLDSSLDGGTRAEVGRVATHVRRPRSQSQVTSGRLSDNWGASRPTGFARLVGKGGQTACSPIVLENVPSVPGRPPVVPVVCPRSSPVVKRTKAREHAYVSSAVILGGCRAVIFDRDGPSGSKDAPATAGWKPALQFCATLQRTVLFKEPSYQTFLGVTPPRFGLPLPGRGRRSARCRSARGSGASPLKS
jgi:hypothetical protein